MNFNIKPSRQDNRDYIYRNDSTKVLRESVDLREWDSDVESQDSLGSCSANAITNAYELCVNRLYPEYFTHLSRLFIYYNTRAEYGDIQIDNGIFLRDGLKSLAKFGVCEESLWPYDLEKFDDRPTDECYANAKKRKILKYQKLISIYYITQVLNNNKPVVFGMEIYDSFMDLNERISTVNFPGRKEKSLGGHAMCMVGYDLEKRLFLAKNSFGTTWGNNGYCWIPFDYIRQEGYDIWTFDIANQTGEPNVLSTILPLLPQEIL
jgi:C1A family cysteine protease